MPDNWGFVAAAYVLTAAVLLLYWRRLAKKERDVRMLERLNAERSRSTAERLTAERSGLTSERLTAERLNAERLNAERSREPSSSGHPRSEASRRPPLQ
jgi:hypothetical protein